jgi:hypothetical protein
VHPVRLYFYILPVVAAFVAHAEEPVKIPSTATQAAAKFLSAAQSRQQETLAKMLAPDASGKFWIESEGLTIWQNVPADTLLERIVDLDAWQCPFSISKINDEGEASPVYWVLLECPSPPKAHNLESTVLGLKAHLTLGKSDLKVHGIWLLWNIAEGTRFPLEP